MFGLMTVKAHKAIVEANKGLLRDILAERAKTKRLEALVECRDAEIASLRPDAEAMRKKRQDDIDRAQAKRDAAKAATKPAREVSVAPPARKREVVVSTKAGASKKAVR